MTAESATRTVLAVLLALFAVPVVLMAVAMPAMLLTGAGPMAAGAGSGWMLLMPLIPLAVFGTVASVLYAELGRRGSEAAER